MIWSAQEVMDMAGNLYKCDTCGDFTRRSGPTYCECGGMLRRTKEARTPISPKVCSECQRVFTPRRASDKTCSPVCALARSRRVAKDAYESKKSGTHVCVQAESWEWLKQDVEADGAPHRKIIDVLSNEYPWVDVLTGNAPAWSAA